MKRFLIALAAVLILTSLAGCGGGGAATTPTTATTSSTGMPGTPTQVAGGTYWVITPSQLYAMGPADLFLVNVDDQPTIVIPNTDLYIKVSEIDQNLSKFPADKSQKIVVYCIAGLNSRTAAEKLVAAGYTRVMHLAGGTMAWQSQGYPVKAYTPAT